ncbi:Hypothetical protein PHPALM_13744 [Phytophthora palmivora]|uniref:Uncharacterized protein n=1 Tax=Phytophthora palmivora TaxID=4796 RepID=A0A2P4XWJ3_9STRA|nr:Hypothetical protein PHPALM_13744 [Phytophthora palmivora]
MSTAQQEHEAKFRLREPRSSACIRVVQDTTKVDGLGGEVWVGALVLCEFLEAHDQEVVQGRDVIELGAGCGLCGLVAATLGAKTVVLTDEYPTYSREISPRTSTFGMTARLTVDYLGELEWGVSASIAPFVHKFDTMVGSEITQLGRDLHIPLLETIRSTRLWHYCQWILAKPLVKGHAT